LSVAVHETGRTPNRFQCVYMPQ